MDCKPNPGDRIRTRDGREGKITAMQTSIRIGGGPQPEPRFAVRFDGDTREHLFFTIRDGDDASHIIAESDIATVIEIGRHDYRKGGATRGHCARCNALKRDHA